MKLQRSVKARKLLLPAALSAALAFGQSAHADNRQLEMVPDDTAFYFGTGKPVAVEDLFAMVPEILKSDGKLWQGLIEAAKSDGERKYLKAVSEFFDDPVKATRNWGLGDELLFSAYAVGVMPVFRIEGDSEKFEAALANLETEYELKFDKMSHKDIDVRILGEKKNSSAPLVAAPSDEEIKKTEETLSLTRDKLDSIDEKIKAATETLDAAKAGNDASGIASSANEIDELRKQQPQYQTAITESEKKLADLMQQKTEAEKLNSTEGKEGPGLVIAADGKDLVFAFSIDAYDPDLLDQLLGTSKPEKSIEASGKVKQIRKEWGYGEEMAMFLDFKLIADVFTGGDSLAARQLEFVATENGSVEDPGLNMLRSEPCKSEITQMAANWPMLVSGNRKFEVNDDSLEIDGHMAMLVEHEALRDTLKLLRGSVPVSQSSSDAMISFGIGLDVDSLPQLSTQITDLIGGVNYTCEPLTAMNQITQTDISPLSLGAMMVSGMARGIKGFSVNLYDTEIDPGNNFMPVSNVDAAIAIAADDPATLISTLRVIPQMGMLAELPLDGTAMSLNDVLPIPMPDGVEIFAAVKDKSIVMYSGEQGADFSNRISGEGKEGFLLSNVNTKKLMEKAETLTGSLPAELKGDEAMVMEMIESYPRGNLFYQIDFTDKGIELESTSDIERP